METRLLLAYSQSVYKELIGNMSLIEMDQITSRFQNEKSLRKDTFYQNEILSFLLEKRRYIDAIPNEEKKSGKITLAYPSRNYTYAMLPPLYQEDLELLNMKELDEYVFIRRVKTKVQEALKNKSGEEIASFFRNFGWLYATTYNIQKGYHQWMRTLSRQEIVKDCVERKNLFNVFRENLEVNLDESNLEMVYFRARNIYDYAKRRDYLLKRKVQNLTITPHFSNAPMQIKKEEIPDTFSSFNQFLEETIRKHPNKRERISDLAAEYEIVRSERSDRR